jgi:hypothetical protein
MKRKILGKKERKGSKKKGKEQKERNRKEVIFVSGFFDLSVTCSIANVGTPKPNYADATDSPFLLRPQQNMAEPSRAETKPLKIHKLPLPPFSFTAY